jgi:alpha-1,6-mannosyltransferase
VLGTLALREVLPVPVAAAAGVGTWDVVSQRHRRAIYFLVLAGVIFRSELALLLFTQVLYLLVLPATSLQAVVPTGIRCALVGLAISIPIDSYFWQTPIWPELSGFIFNALHGNSSAWGTSPYHTYFTSALPKLLLNPLLLPLIALSLYLPSTHRAARGLTIPSLAFIAIYSLQPHKEARFIIYVVPPLTAAAALGASHIFTRRTKSLLYALLSVLLVLSVLASFAASTVMLAISSLNYPGGEALWTLHQIVDHDLRNVSQIASPRTVTVHMDVLSCMTGVSRFQQDHPTPPFSSFLLGSHADAETSSPNDVVRWRYSKEENDTTLLMPEFWEQFDYVLTESPERIIGKWDIVYTVYGYAGIEVLRPGSQAEVADEASDIVGFVNGKGIAGHPVLAAYWGIREVGREKITKGWWIGPRMAAKVRILRKIP